jgi:hypothetical protein
MQYVAIMLLAFAVWHLNREVKALREQVEAMYRHTLLGDNYTAEHIAVSKKVTEDCRQYYKNYLDKACKERYMGQEPK